MSINYSSTNKLFIYSMINKILLLTFVNIQYMEFIYDDCWGFNILI